MTFELKNTGGSATAALKVSITGSGASRFTKTGDTCSATSLGPGKTCSITIVYSPSAAGATDTATLTAMSKKPTASASVSLTGHGTPANTAPTATDDSYTVAEGGTLNGSSVLANDIDAENDTLTAVLVSGPANASTLTFNPDGSFSYVHNGGETFTDSFFYKANDGTADSNVATVTITVNPVNDAPVASNDSYSVAEGGTLNGSSVLANDTDAENTTLTAVLVSSPANASSFGLNADGTFSYVHNGTETTNDSFTYQANDGSANSNVATVNISVTPVNDVPSSTADVFTLAESGDADGGNLLANDVDPDGDPLTLFGPCQDLVIDTSGVAGDVAAKLPGLDALTSDSSLSDGDGCLWAISSNDGVGTWTLDPNGDILVSTGTEESSPYVGLETGDVLVVTSSYVISDGFGGAGSNVFIVKIFGSS